MEPWRKKFIVTVGFVEALLFSGCLFGWPSLLLVLQEEGIYRDLCMHDDFVTENSFENTWSNGSVIMEDAYLLSSENILTNLDDISTKFQENNGLEYGNTVCDDDCQAAKMEKLKQKELLESLEAGCDEQRVQMGLIYTAAAIAYGVTAIFIGISLEYLGLWATRLVGSTLGGLGFVCLALTTPDNSNLLWPALNLIALGTNQLRLSGFQFANLFPAYRATILTSYSCAYAISTTVFLGVQILYEHGIPVRPVFLACGIALFLTCIPTFFMPKFKIEESRTSKSTINLEEMFTETDTYNEANETFLEGKKVEEKEATYWKSLCSISGVLHLYWQFINLFLVLFFTATLNIWASKVTNNQENASFYIKMSGVCSLIAPIFIPLTGILTDRMIHQAEKLSDPVEKLAYKMQAPTFSMAGATVLLVITMVCKLFITETAIYVSLMLIAMTRPSIIGSCTAYIRMRFPAHHFNILNGIFTTVISILCFVQYPIMIWMTSSHEAYIWAHWILILSLLLSLTSPGHMMIKSNITRYAQERLSCGK